MQLHPVPGDFEGQKLTGAVAERRLAQRFWNIEDKRACVVRFLNDSCYLKLV